MKNSVLQRGTNATVPIRSARSVATTSDGEELLEAAQEIKREQQVALEAAPIEQTYQQALAVYVQSKFDQVDRIEDRLQNLIDRQQDRLQQAQAAKPGFLARPGTRQTWQSRQAQQQARLQVLHTRLEMVRDIKEGMGIHGPKIEELATRKMRAEHPELASDWDAMREAARRHQALTRKQERERKLAQEQRLGRSHSLSLSRTV
ncbi:IncP plasmid survival protein KfrC family protein [Nitrosomonas halophila]|uniref:Conjugal transfer protein n=1 Tax=Nitrosomonas halophila TaxID=44576 RepID=A0A1H3MYA9_9PROT|nr:IncP plasmid survival protein KfrC family protein [Nitrosomonas halophila]SDY81707.1 hypothetical protein SAMN05421881_106612 [Nitrosomonas halophila]